MLLNPPDRLPRAINRGGLRNARRGPAPVPWVPADEIAGGAYVWEASALSAPRVTAGQTFLDDMNGGTITLQAKDALAPSQAAYLAAAADGMPALEFVGTDGSQRLTYTAAMTFHAQSLFYLIRPTAPGTVNTSSGFAAGIGSDPGGIQVAAGVAGAFRAVVVGTAPTGSTATGSLTDFTGQWVCGVIEMDPVAQTLRHFANGGLYGDVATYTPAGPFTLGRLVLGAGRAQTNGTPMQFAHGFILSRVDDATRAKGVAYLRRLWGARVTGWA